MSEKHLKRCDSCGKEAVAGVQTGQWYVLTTPNVIGSHLGRTIDLCSIGCVRATIQMLDAGWRVEKPTCASYSYTLRWGEDRVKLDRDGQPAIYDKTDALMGWLHEWPMSYDCLIFEHKGLSAMGDMDSPTRQSASRCCNTETVRCEAAQPMMFWDSVNECWAQGKWHEAQAGEWCLPVAAKRRRT